MCHGQPDKGPQRPWPLSPPHPSANIRVCLCPPSPPAPRGPPPGTPALRRQSLFHRNPRTSLPRAPTLAEHMPPVPPHAGRLLLLAGRVISGYSPGPGCCTVGAPGHRTYKSGLAPAGSLTGQGHPSHLQAPLPPGSLGEQEKAGSPGTRPGGVRRPRRGGGGRPSVPAGVSQGSRAGGSEPVQGPAGCSQRTLPAWPGSRVLPLSSGLGLFSPRAPGQLQHGRALGGGWAGDALWEAPAHRRASSSLSQVLISHYFWCFQHGLYHASYISKCL